MAPDANDKNLFKWHEDKKKGERESENKNKVGILCTRARRRRIDAVVTSQHGIVRMASSSSPDAYIVLIKVDICLFDGERISVFFFSAAAVGRAPWIVGEGIEFERWAARHTTKVVAGRTHHFSMMCQIGRSR